MSLRESQTDLVEGIESLPGPVAVTGCTGVIGTALVNLLGDLGIRVVPLCSHDADLRDATEALSALASTQPGAVVHLAGRVRGVLGNRAAQGQMFLDNLLINTNVIDAARQLGVHKVVVMGSVSIYADGLVQPVREEDIWHGPPHRSEAGYAHAKRAMLAQLEMYRDQYGMDYACAISTNLFGPNDRFDELNGHVVPSLISKFHRAVRSEGTVVAWGSGTPTRDFLYSEDAAAALVILLARGHGAYNLASGTHVTIRTLVETIATVSGYDGDITWDPSKPDGQSSRSFNIERLTDLGWRPDTSLEEALRQTFDWYATNASTARH